MRGGHPAAAGLRPVRGDAGFSGRDVRGHAGPPAAAAEPAESLHQGHEVRSTQTEVKHRDAPSSGRSPGSAEPPLLNLMSRVLK